MDQRQDAQGVAALLTRGRAALGTVTRAILGLPIQFFFKTLHAALVAQGLDPREARRRASATVAPSRGQARGSPLFFRVVGFPGTPARYGLLMGLFRSRFLPDHEMIIRPGDYSIKPVRVAVPGNFALIERWFQHVESQQVPLLPVALVGGTGEG